MHVIKIFQGFFFFSKQNKKKTWWLDLWGYLQNHITVVLQTRTEKYTQIIFYLHSIFFFFYKITSINVANADLSQG